METIKKICGAEFKASKNEFYTLVSFKNGLKWVPILRAYIRDDVMECVPVDKQIRSATEYYELDLDPCNVALVWGIEYAKRNKLRK